MRCTCSRCRSAGLPIHVGRPVARNISNITTKVNTGRGTLGALINNNSVYQQASGAAAALHEDAHALKHNFLLRGYFNKRGFADPTEVQKHEVAKLPEGRPERTFSYNPKQMFEGPDSAKLKSEKSLDQAGAYLQSQNSGVAIIEASAGPKGEAEEDKELSLSRADAVRRYLLDHYKLDDARLKIIGLGKTEGDASLRILVYGTPQTDARH